MNNQDRFLGLIEDSIKAHWDFPALTDHQGVTYYYKDMAAEMARLHLLLEHAGVRKGDRVALIGRNSSRWVIAFFGILTYGAVATPILHDFHPENVHHIVCHSESKVLLAASASWEKLSADAMPDLTAALLLEDWSVVLSRHPGIDRLRERLETDFAEPVAGEVAPFNILHICESGGHITPATFDDYLDYPGSIINPPMHNFKDSTLTLRQISERFRRPVLGGMQRWGALYKGTLEEAKAEVDAILREAPANFIFGADDSLPNDSDPEKVRRLVDYIHTWRLTHKASAAQ